MQKPNLQALRMFDAAARHLNFRRAAEELNLTQGAVAQQVRKLEADLDLQLFHRRARGLALTDIGAAYHRPVSRALTIIDEATLDLRPGNRRITLSVTPSLASKWLVPRLAGFARKHPEIDLKTVATEDLANFQTDGVDLAIRQVSAHQVTPRQGRPLFADGLVGTLLTPLDLCAICAPDFAARLAPVTAIADFLAHPLIQDSHAHWRALFESAGLKAPRRMLQFNQTALAMDAAANGQGITLAPRLLAAADIASGRLVEIWRDTGTGHSGFYLVRRDQRKPAPARDAVVAWILAQLPPPAR